MTVYLEKGRPTIGGLIIWIIEVLMSGNIKIRGGVFIPTFVTISKLQLRKNTMTTTSTPFVDVAMTRAAYPGGEFNDTLLQAVVTTPVPYGKHGCRHVSLRHPQTRAGGRIYIDNVDIPTFGISDNGYAQMNAQLSISPATKAFLRGLQNHLLDLAYASRATWFPEVESKEALQKQFTPMFKEGRLKRDGDSWPALMRVSLGPNLYRADFEELKGKHLSCVTVDCSVIYLNANGRWGVKMILDSFIVKDAFGSEEEKALYTKFYRTPFNSKKRISGEAKTRPSSPVKKSRLSPIKREKEQEEPIPPMTELKRSVNDCDGCINDRPSQKDHMGPGGCLHL